MIARAKWATIMIMPLETNRKAASAWWHVELPVPGCRVASWVSAPESTVRRRGTQLSGCTRNVNRSASRPLSTRRADADLIASFLAAFRIVAPFCASLVVNSAPQHQRRDHNSEESVYNPSCDTLARTGRPFDVYRSAQSVDAAQVSACSRMSRMIPVLASV